MIEAAVYQTDKDGSYRSCSVSAKSRLTLFRKCLSNFGPCVGKFVGDDKETKLWVFSGCRKNESGCIDVVITKVEL